MNPPSSKDIKQLLKKVDTHIIKQLAKLKNNFDLEPDATGRRLVSANKNESIQEYQAKLTDPEVRLRMIKINVLNAAKAFLTAKQSGKQDTADILEKARRLIDQAKLSPEYKDQTSTLFPSPKGAETEQLIKQCCKIARQTLREEDAARLSTGDRP